MKEAAGLNIVLAITDLATQLLLVIVGIVLVLSPDVLVHNVHLGVAPTWKSFLVAIPIGMIAYTGIETISNMAEEARDETKTIPQGDQVRRARRLRDLCGAADGRALGAAGAQTGRRPVHHAARHHEAHGGFAGIRCWASSSTCTSAPCRPPGEIYVGLLAATILFIAANAGIIGASRLVYSMGLHRQVPDRLSRLHPRFSTPWIGILLFGGVACLTIIPGKAEFLGNMYAFGAMLSFTIAHLSVIRLRVKEPDRPRPYRGPGTLRVAGRELPVFALLGIFGTGLAFITVTILHLEVAVAGVAWLALGMALLHPLPPTARARPAHDDPSAAPRAPARLRGVRLPHGAGADLRQGRQRQRPAQRGEADRRTTASSTRSSSCRCPASSRWRRASRTRRPRVARCSSARIQARRLGIKIHTGLIRTRNPGAALVEEAERVGADVIYWSTIHAPAGEQRIGPTAAYLLSRRPCRVIIETENRPGRPREGVPAPA